ncbi:MAG: Asp-tRNA(Asn)/Glu-tRNA(Gln) amidotransferase subunit GatC [Nanoarchaeota archaeon]|nr:Asp-tRNA(Asn)/Glu-tRNA(Gln) amidotransferase subunit GatC [Nanoarchaeota archaeon]
MASEEMIRHVARVARLNLSDAEVIEFLPQLSEIISAFTEISKVDTAGLEPSFQPVVLTPTLREDVPGKCLSEKEALSNTPHRKEGYFKGPSAL